MKYLVVLLAIFAVVAADTWLPQPAEGIRETHRECAKEAELTPEQLEKAENFEFPDEDQVHKYVFCFGQKLRVFCKDSGYNTERLFMQFDLRMEDDEVKSVIKGCLDENEQNSATEVWAYRGAQCMWKSKVGDELKDIFKRESERLAKKDEAAA